MSEYPDNSPESLRFAISTLQERLDILEGRTTPAPVAPDVPKDAEARAISAFNLKAADLCMPFRIRDDDDKQAMRAALAAYATVAPGEVITKEQVERACEAYDPMWNCRLMVEKQTIRGRMHLALSAALSPGGKVGEGKS